MRPPSAGTRQPRRTGTQGWPPKQARQQANSAMRPRPEHSLHTCYGHRQGQSPSVGFTLWESGGDITTQDGQAAKHWRWAGLPRGTQDCNSYREQPVGAGSPRWEGQVQAGVRGTVRGLRHPPGASVTSGRQAAPKKAPATTTSKQNSSPHLDLGSALLKDGVRF